MEVLRAFLKRIGIGALGLAWPLLLTAQQHPGLELHQFDGKLGNSRIGLTVVRHGDRVEGGHYFYQKFLRDIPIKGSFDGTELNLIEPGGGRFKLRFVGNGSEHGQPLDFENSVGMNGDWTSADGSRTYHVVLRGTLILSVENAQRRYSQITRETDAAFEERVQSFWHAALNGEKNRAVKFVSYPLTINVSNHKRRSLESPNAVLANWNSVFTPALIALLKNDLPHDMFVHNGMAMLGNGEAWFDDKGLAVINLPKSPEVN